MKKEIILDVKGKTLGRAASEVAAILRGKTEPTFESNKIPDIKLVVLNVEDLKTTGNKANVKTYKSYSGYPGGLKTMSFARAKEKGGMAKIFRTAVDGMLCKNKLKKQMLKNLDIKK